MNLLGKKISTLFLIATAALGIGGMGVGCTTVQQTEMVNGQPVTKAVKTLDTNTVMRAIGDIVPPAVTVAVGYERNSGPYLQQVAIALRLLAERGEFDPAQVHSSLSQISIAELRSDRAVQVEQTALGLYRLFFANVVDQQLDRVQWLKPVLLSLADAIDEGLRAATPMPPTPGAMLERHPQLATGPVLKPAQIISERQWRYVWQLGQLHLVHTHVYGLAI